jgi:adenylate cyclase class 2
VEVEVKIRVDRPAAVRQRLKRAGYALQSRHREQDAVFDDHGRLRGSGQLLRLRNQDGRWLLTYKGPPVAGSRYKEREEIETGVEHGPRLRLVLERLGFQRWFAYEKRRLTYQRRGERGLVTLDHTPIGDFLELEGPRTWIDRTASRLGFGPADYITKSYFQLYAESCLARGAAPADMLFGRP